MREEANINALLAGAWNWLRFSAALPALLAGGLGLSSQVLLGTPVRAGWLLGLVFAVFAIYQLDRLLSVRRDDAETHPARANWTAEHARALGVILASAVVLAAILGTPIARAHPLTVAAVFLISASYAVTLGPDGIRLKDVWWLKPVLVAAVWTIAVGSLVLPGGRAAVRSFSWIVPYRFLFLLTNVLLCEVVEGRSNKGATAGMVSRLGMERTLAAARIVGCAALLTGALAAASTGYSVLLVADLMGVVALLALSSRWLIARIHESSVVDLATLWPVAVAVFALLVH
ncbi:MAG TPA: hypothetical protein VF190_11275 [Rhodothermales bacterium]